MAQQSVLTTKTIRKWEITGQKLLLSGNEGIRDLVLVFFCCCCERLLSNCVNLNYNTWSRTKVMEKIGKGRIILK